MLWANESPRRRTPAATARALLGGAAVAALCAGCGGPTAPLTGTAPHASRAPADAVYGAIVDTGGGRVEVESPDGADSRFAVTPATRVTRIAAADSFAISPMGTCVLAAGQPGVDRALVAIWALVEGSAGCTTAGGGLMSDPRGVTVGQGTVVASAPQLLTLQAPDGGRRQLAYTVGTAIGVVLDGGLGDLVDGRCAVARGSRSGAGPLVASRVTLVPAPTGGCFSGGGGVGLLSFVDPRSGEGAPGIPEGAGYIAPGGTGVSQGQSGVSNGGGAVQQVTPQFPVASEGLGAQRAPQQPAGGTTQSQPGTSRGGTGTGTTGTGGQTGTGGMGTGGGTGTAGRGTGTGTTGTGTAGHGTGTGTGFSGSGSGGGGTGTGSGGSGTGTGTGGTGTGTGTGGHGTGTGGHGTGGTGTGTGGTGGGSGTGGGR